MAKKIKLYDKLLREEMSVWLSCPRFLNVREVREEAEDIFVSIGNIEDYLKIRQISPAGENFRANICSGDFMELKPKLSELTDAGFPDQYLNRLLSDDTTIYDDLSCHLLEDAANRRNNPPEAHAASLGKVYKDADINFLVALMLEKCARTNTIPNSLVYLAGLRLVGENSNHRADFLFHRFAATVFGAVKECFKKGQKVTLRTVSKMVGVEHTSISRQLERLKKHWELLSNRSGEYWLFADEDGKRTTVSKNKLTRPVRLPF